MSAPAGNPVKRRGYEFHGESRTKLYMVWWSMISRCKYDGPRYRYHHGRGISVCKAWAGSYLRFRTWAKSNGYVEGLELDRKNTNGNYKPSNCRFVTASVNQRNTRRNHYETYLGETKILDDWARDPRCAVVYKTFCGRLHRDWPMDKAFTLPIHARHKCR